MKSRAGKLAVKKSSGEEHQPREDAADESAIVACGPLPAQNERLAGNTSKLEKPQAHFKKAAEVAGDKNLSRDEKKNALDTWEQDARQLLTASNEGMPGKEEGLSPDDAPKLGEVVRAKADIGEKPKLKPAH